MTTPAGTRWPAVFAALFAGAGFKLTRVVPTPTGHCIVEGQPV